MTIGTLLTRIAKDHRRVLVPLAVLALVNVALYALAVYPLSLKVASSERRAENTAVQLSAAQNEADAVHATLARTEQADHDLARFYTDVLPADLSGARRLTYARLASLADARNLSITRRTYTVDQTYKGRLHRLEIAMTLNGDYADIREFLYAVETAPEFVVIEDVGLVEGAKTEAGLTVSLRLATYFRGENHGR